MMITLLDGMVSLNVANAGNIIYNSVFTVSVSSAIPDYDLTLTATCNNSWSQNYTVKSNGDSSITFGTNVPAFATCDLQTEATSAFNTSNIVSVQVIPADISISASPIELTAGLSNITYNLTVNSASTLVNVSLTCFGQELSRVEVNAPVTAATFEVLNNYYGQCFLDATTDDSSYMPTAPVPITIYSPITISNPDANDQFNTSSTIPVVMSAANGLYPEVTVNLTCNGVLAGSDTGSIEYPLNITDLQTYGACVVYVDPLPYYNVTNATVAIVVNRILDIILPTDGQSILVGANYLFNATALYGSTSDPVDLIGTCEQGTGFTANSTVGVETIATMSSGAYGTCSVIARSPVNYYLDSAPITIEIVTNLTILSPTIDNGWVYGAGNSTTSITTSAGIGPNGTVNVACTYLGASTFDDNLIVINGANSSYNMLGFGYCNMSTLFPTDEFSNTFSMFYSTVPVTLSVPAVITYGENFNVTANTQLVGDYNLTLNVRCGLTFDQNYTATINEPTEVTVSGLVAGTRCFFQTYADDAFQASSANSVIAARLTLLLSTQEATAGQTIEYNVAASDLEEGVPVFVNITCPTTSYSVSTATTNFSTSQPLTLPTNLFGNCSAVASPQSGNNYTDSNPFLITILSPMTIVSPLSGANFTLGDAIPVNVTTANGANPLVTVNLTCASVLQGQNASVSSADLIYLTPDLTAYGACIITAGTDAPYYNVSLANVDVNVYRQLVISSPTAGSRIIGGTYYTLNVSSVDGDTSNAFELTGTCANSTSFNVSGSINVEKFLPMAADVQGVCTLAATTTAAYYYNSSAVLIDVPTNVTITSPGPNTVWNYNQSNTGQVSAASGIAINNQPILITCFYNGIRNKNANLTVNGGSFSISSMDGFGECTAQTVFDPATYVQTQVNFNSTTQVTISASQSLTLKSLAKSLVKRVKRAILRRKKK